jgi:hypothetical protein
MRSTTEAAENLRVRLDAGLRAERCPQPRVGGERAQVARKSGGVGRQQARQAWVDDVAGAAGLHGGNRRAERRRLDEHAAQ